MNWPLFNTAAVLALVLVLVQYRPLLNLTGQRQTAPGTQQQQQQQQQQPSEDELDALIRELEEEEAESCDDEDDVNDNGNGNDNGAPEDAQEDAQQDAPELNWPAPPPRWQRGPVSRKKAKSLARREQRRAYFEWVRHEADARRADEHRAEEIFGDLIQHERQLRQQRISEARKSLAIARAERRAAAETERARQAARREELASLAQSSSEPIHLLPGDRALVQDLGVVVQDGKWLVTERALEDPLSKVAGLLKDRGTVTWCAIVEELNKSERV